MCKHMKNVPEHCCLQCFREKNGATGDDFFTANMFAKSVANTIAQDVEIKHNKQLLDIGDFKADYDGVDVKVKLMQGK